MNTIIQLATPRANSAIHIIRVSGEQSSDFLKKHTQLNSITPRKVYHTAFFYQEKIIDYLICFYFKSPQSYTGEDMVELQCHGSILIVEQILKLAIQEGLHLAAPGEFTFRAFINGKITLEEGEAIHSLITASSLQQKENALRIIEKKSSLQFEKILHQILTILAELESTIEFPEEDLPEVETDQNLRYLNYLNQIKKLESYFKVIHANYQKGKKIDSGIKVVLIGKPNVGKSTLMNLLLRDDRSIISPESGTTRDYLKESWQLDSFTLQLFDTAGIHETDYQIEQAGIEKSLNLIKEADLLIWLITLENNYNPTEEYLKIKNLSPKSTPILIYLNKNDLIENSKLVLESHKNLKEYFKKENLDLSGTFSLTKTPEKAVLLIEEHIKQFLKKNYSVENNDPSLLNERQASIVKKIIAQFPGIKTSLEKLEHEEIVVEEFREIIELLNEINLKVTQEKIFDHLFSQFCLGK